MTETEKASLRQLSHTSDLKERSTAITTLTKGLLDDGRVVPLVVRGYQNAYRSSLIDVDGMVDFDGDILFSKMRLKD